MDLQNVKDRMVRDAALLQKTMTRISRNREKLLKSHNVNNVWELITLEREIDLLPSLINDMKIRA